MPPPSNAPNPEANSLGLSARDMEALLERLDATREGSHAPNRNYTRWPFRRSGVLLELTHPGGSVSKIRVICRNISAGGIALLHNNFLYAGSRCRITLQKTSGTPATLSGVVRRCQHVSGKVHELGIQFTETIDLRDFIPPRRESTVLTFEKVNPEKLRGRVLHVEDSPIDQRIVGHFLRETAIRITAVNDAESARAALKEPFDLILADWQLPGATSGLDLISAIRVEGLDTPALMVTADPEGLIKAGLWDLNNAWYLAKPLDQTQLLRAVAERLVTERRPGEHSGEAEGGQAASNPFAQQFIEDLRGCADKLRDAAQAVNVPQARMLSLQLKGAAPVFGFHDLGHVAGQAAEKLGSAEISPTAAGPIIRALVAACDRVLNAA